MPALRSRSATSSSVRGRSLDQPLDAGRQAEGDDGVSSSDGEVSDGLSSRDGDACGQCENGVKAITRCTACNIFLCEHCTIAHTKSKTSREHPLVVLRGLVRAVCRIHMVSWTMQTLGWDHWGERVRKRSWM